jgi:hypothetical protein
MDGVLALCNTLDGRAYTTTKLKGRPETCAISPDRTRVIVGDNPGGVRVFSIDGGS